MGIFSQLFKRKRKLPPVEWSQLKVDVHSHFIPGIDDGAPTLEDSLKLIEKFVGMGYQKVITTPHVMSDYYRNTPEIILGGLEKVREGIKEKGWAIEIEAAAEYYLDPEFEDSIPKRELLSFGNNNYVLFELPFISEPPMLNDVIFSLQTHGYRPVLAHPERYGFWYQDYKKYQEMIDRGVLLQLNINSMTGHYSPETKKIGEQLVKDGLIRFLGSDCHHLGHTELMAAAALEPSIHQAMDSGLLLNAEL